MAKIKRYRNIYNSKKMKRKRIIKTLLFILLCAVLIFIGYSVAGPVMDFISGRLSGNPSSQMPNSGVSSGENSSGQTSSDSSGQSSSQAPVAPDNLNMSAVIDPSTLTLDAFNTQLDTLKSQGITGVVLLCKNEEGKLLYQTSNEVAVSAKAVVDAPVQMSDYIQAIKEKDMVPVAAMHVFKDCTLTKVKGDYAITYGDTQTRWVDDYPENGGKSWVNPYSSAARSYMIAIAEELVDMGFEHVMYFSVQFPDGSALDKMGFGDTGGKSKMEILQEFITSSQDALAAKGVGLTVVVPQGDETVYERRYGGDPNLLGAQDIQIQ